VISDDLVVRSHQVDPGAIATLGGELCGADDVGEHDRRETAIQ